MHRFQEYQISASDALHVILQRIKGTRDKLNFPRLLIYIWTPDLLCVVPGYGTEYSIGGVLSFLLVILRSSSKGNCCFDI